METNGYCEVLVKVKPSQGEKMVGWALRASAWFFLAVGVLFLLWGVLDGAISLFWPAWLAAILFAVGAKLWKRFHSLEYEYQYLDGSLRIDKIIAMKKRKQFGRYDLEGLNLMAPVGDERLRPYQNNPKYKAEDLSSHDPAAPNRYQLVFKSLILTMEPSQHMVKLMWRAAPSKVIRQREGQ